MMDGKNISVVENGDISRYRKRNDLDENKIDFIMSAIEVENAVTSQKDEVEKLKKIDELLKKGNAAVQEDKFSEAAAYMDEALALNSASQNHCVLILKCTYDMIQDDWSATMADIGKAYEILADEYLEEFETTTYTYIYENIVEAYRNLFHEMMEVKMGGKIEQLDLLEKGMNKIITNLAGVKRLLRDKTAGAVFQEMTVKNGWDMDIDLLFAEIACMGFAYTRAGQAGKDYVELLAPGVAVGKHFHCKLEAIGQDMMVRMLDLIDDCEKKAALCERLAMSYARTVDKNELQKACEANGQARKYFKMMTKLSSSYKRRYEVMRTEVENQKKVSKNLQIEWEILNAGLMQLSISLESVEQEIRRLQEGTFYFLNIFAWADVNNLKEKRQKLQKDMAVKKKEIRELENSLKKIA